MSTDWNVYCLDCASTLEIENGRMRTAIELCHHASAVADLSRESIELRFIGTYVNRDWFETHAKHRLAPINEYGELLGQCTERVTCGCGSSAVCTRDDQHEGPHDPTSQQNKERGGPRAVTADQAAALLNLLRVAEKWRAGDVLTIELTSAIREARTAIGPSS